MLESFALAQKSNPLFLGMDILDVSGVAILLGHDDPVLNRREPVLSLPIFATKNPEWLVYYLIGAAELTGQPLDLASPVLSSRGVRVNTRPPDPVRSTPGQNRSQTQMRGEHTT